MNLLKQARAAGLNARIDADGGLVVSGPKRLGDLARQLLAHREDVVSALRAEIAREGSGQGHQHGEPHGHPIDDCRLKPDPPLRLRQLPPGEFLDTITAQHCHPAVLADRIGWPLAEVLQRLEASPWAGHGARARARLGLSAATVHQPPSSSSLPAPPESHLHFRAR